MLKSALEMLPPYMLEGGEREEELSTDEVNDIWRGWARVILDEPFVPILAVELQHFDAEDFDDAQHGLVKAWRSMLMYWALGKRDFKLSHDKYLQTAKYFFENALTADPNIVRTGKLLTRASMDLGNTSPDTLFLVAAFAWPLRITDPSFSRICWDYFVNAPWQTDSATLCLLFEAANAVGALRRNLSMKKNDRALLTLVEEQFAAGQPNAARETLEAVAICQTSGRRKQHIDDIRSVGDFAAEEALDGAFDCMKRLATFYMENNETGIHARAVGEFVSDLFDRSDKKKGLGLDGPDDSPKRVRVYLSDTVWDRPFEEASALVGKMGAPRHLEREIERAMGAGQIHHARRLAEAAIVREYGGFFSGKAQKHIPGAFENFIKTPSQKLFQDQFARTAVNHLAPIYVETDFKHKRATDLILKIADKPFFVGTGGPLEPIREDLDRFVNTADVFDLLRKANRPLEYAEELTDDEERGREQVLDWFETRYSKPSSRTILDTFVSAVSATPQEAKDYHDSLPLVEQTMVSALELMFRCGHQLVGDEEALRHEGRRIRQGSGVGKNLMDVSREVTKPNTYGATAVSTALGLLPPGLPSIVGGSVDLGSTMLLCFRGIAQVAALYGKPRLTSTEGFQFVLDSFVLGCSSENGEGLLAYLDDPKRGELSPVTVGAVEYGTKRLQKHLWTRTSGKPRQVVHQAIEHIARLCGLSLSKNVTRKVVPVVGAIYCGFTTYEFINDVIEASIYVASRDGLQNKIGDGDAEAKRLETV